MSRPGSRHGVSKLAIPIGLVVVVAVAGAYLLLGGSRTPSTTQTSSGSTPTVPLQTVVDQLVNDINQRNVDGLTTFYTKGSVVHWSGNTGGLSGLYTGTDDIRLMYATTVGKTTQMSVNSTGYAEKALGPTDINATFVLNMKAKSPTVGDLNATIDVTQEWKWGSSGWAISRENWAYTGFSASLFNAQYPPATTFPQWAYSLKGGNPDLVSEKSFEWHAGPFLAAGLYGFLFGVVALAAVRILSGGRKGWTSR
jgi:hypothetical protein